MPLVDGWPAQSGAADQIEIRKDLAGLVVRDTAGNARGGIFPRHTNPLVSSTATMNVTVATFEGFVVRAGGPVFIANADGSSNVLLDAAPAANSRTDVVYARQNENGYGGLADGTNGTVFGVAKGTAAASPTVPSVPAGALPLAQVTIPSTATATNSAGVVITQVFPYTAAAGGVLLLANQAQEAAASVVEGQPGYRLDQSLPVQVVGGRWVADGSYAELDATPVLGDTGAVQDITLTVNSSRSNRPGDIISSQTGADILLFPGLYDVTAAVSLNNSGNPQPVNGRSFIQFIVPSYTSGPNQSPNLRSAVFSGEDSWITSGTIRITGATPVAARVQVYKTSGGSAGSNIKLKIVRSGS